MATCERSSPPAPGSIRRSDARTESATSSCMTLNASAAWTLNRDSGSWPARPTHGVRAGGADERFVAFALVAPDVRLFLAEEERLPPSMNEPPVVLHRRRVAPERPADLQVLAFDDALGTGDLAPDDGAVDGGLLVPRPRARGNQPLHSVAREQVVLEAHEET